MKTIWKKDLIITPQQVIRVPEGAEVLHIREQYERPCIWFKCDPQKELADRSIIIVGTGHELPENTRYLGTCQLQEGDLMLHVFELIPQVN